MDQLADQNQIAGLKAGLEIPANEYLKAMRIRALIQEAFRDLLSTIDVLIAPTRFTPAPKITQPLDRAAATARVPTPGFSALIPAGNLAGLPALSSRADLRMACRWACNWWAAVLGKHAAGDRKNISGADRLAQAPAAGRDVMKLFLALILASTPAFCQNNYEIQVYGSELCRPIIP